MSLFNSIAILLTLAAVLSYINYRYIRLPTTIGLMLIALVLSMGLVWLGKMGYGIGKDAELFLRGIDFEETLLHGVLSFLLFAGALHVNINDLADQKKVIGLLATAGVIGSTFIIGGMVYFLFRFMGFDVPMIFCLLFGSLISPTDPIAVLGIMKTAGAKKSIETKIVGESLFNDGVAVVVFLVLLEIATGHQDVGVVKVVSLFATEAIGGLLFGLAAGFLVYRMLKSVDNYQVEVLITLALVTGGYAMAEKLHISAPIAIVVAGLLIGNHGRMLAMSDRTRDNIDTFWELIDEILNAVLFLLIGLEVLVITFTTKFILAGLLVIPIVLLSRFISVSIPVMLLKRFRSFSPRIIRILTWAGLRGGISVAMALALPINPHRDILIAVTYSVVVFSIVVQGLTVGKMFAENKQ